MLRGPQRPLVVRPEAQGPGPESELALMHEPELPRRPALTMPGLGLGPGARTAFAPVARSPAETANHIPMRRRPRRQLQRARPWVLRASLPFDVWPACSCLSPDQHAQERYPAKFKKLRSDFA